MSDFEKRTEFGNLQANIRFLDQTSLLDKKKRILEIGSGTAGLLNQLFSRGLDIRGVEINPEVIEIGKTMHGELPLTLIDSVSLPFECDTFDIVMSFDVFEHIEDSDAHLREVRALLKEGGYYLLQTPNKWTNTVFETIRWKSLTKWKKDHCALHGYSEIIRRFQRNGFSVEFYDNPVSDDYFLEKVRYYLGPLGVYIAKHVRLDGLPIKWRTNFYLIARKVADAHGSARL